jgi:NAD(P)H dehydrogenase (quinone)
MNSSSNLLVLGATGQVGKHVAKNLKGRNANFSVGSRRAGNLKELADQFGASRFIDLDDPRTFDEALKNVAGIFLITGYTVDMLVQSNHLLMRQSVMVSIISCTSAHSRQTRTPTLRFSLGIR